MPNKNIIKIGGAIISSPNSIHCILKKIFLKIEQPIIIFSAIGKTSKALAELQILAENDNYYKKLDELINFHLDFVNKPESIDAINTIKLDLEKYLSAICIIGECSEIASDAILYYGEKLAGVIYSEMLEDFADKVNYIKAEEKIISNQERYPDIPKSVTNLKKEFDASKTTLLAGFISKNHEGYISNMGFESSNLTSLIAAIAFDVKKVTWITDVAGFFDADPNIFSNAKLINTLDINEALILSKNNIKLLPKNAIELAKKHNIEITLSGIDLKPSTKISRIDSSNTVLIFDDNIKIIGNPEYNIIQVLKLFPSEKIEISNSTITIDSNSFEKASKLKATLK